MNEDLEWKNVRGMDVLVQGDGQVIATVRMMHDHMWKATYGDDPPKLYIDRDKARRAMLRRHEEAQKALAELREKKDKKVDEKSKEKEK